MLFFRGQIPLREDLVIQSEPFASFHSLFESRQHGNSPDGRFDPCPAGADLFDLLSPTGIPGGHCRRSFVHSSSISPEPFAPPAFPSTAGQDGAMDGPPGTWAPRPRDRRPMAPVGSRTRSDGLSVYGVRPPDPLGTCCQSATRSGGGFGSGMVSAVGCTRQVTGSSSASNATGSATWTGLTPVAGSW